jgi:tetratricopeptide (TPR) repeat protein
MLLWSAILLVCSCSTAPKPQEDIVVVKNRAAEYAGYGNDYYRQGLYDKAIESFELSLAYNGSVDNEPGIVSSYNSLGKVNLAKGELETAAGYFLAAYELAVELGDDDLTAQTLNHQGELAMQGREYDRAVELYLKALELAEGAGSDRTRATILGNLGSGYRKLGQLETALSYFESSVEINARTKNFEELATSYYRIAALHSEMGEYTVSLQHIENALENDKKVENSLGIAKDYLAKGIILKKAGKPEQAYVSFQRSLLVYRSMALLFPDVSFESDVRRLLEYLIEIGDAFGRAEAADYRRILEGEKE